MRRVSHDEARMIRWLDVVWGVLPLESIVAISRPLRTDDPSAHAVVGSHAAALIRDRLTRGAVRYLSQTGWRRETFLSEERRVAGRLWERHSPDRLALTFSEATLRFLQWISFPTSEGQDLSEVDRSRITSGDRLLFFVACERLAGTTLEDRLARHPWLVHDGLMALAFSEWTSATVSTIAPDFRPWLQSHAVWMLEALQSRLAARWEAGEVAIEHASSPAEQADRRERRARLLNAWLHAIALAGRFDLARFVLTAAARRLETRSVSGNSVETLRLLKDWERRARTVGYFDERYEASQLWLSDWERFEGDRMLAQAEERAAPKASVAP